MQNPYAPPEINLAVSKSLDKVDDKPSKPIIPAIIGLFTYGSASPYALVLCIEQYLQQGFRRLPFSIHIATLLATLGSVAWFSWNILIATDVLNWMVGNPASMYVQVGFMMWTATLVFFIWLAWRVIRFRKLPRLSER